MKFKWLNVPSSNDTKDIQVPQLWEVRWQSRNGEYSGNVAPEMEGFLTEEEANTFALSLTNAFKLIKHTSGNAVTVRRAK